MKEPSVRSLGLSQQAFITHQQWEKHYCRHRFFYLRPFWSKNLFSQILFPKHVHVLPRWCCGKESTSQCRRCKRYRFSPWVGKIPGVGNGHPLQYSWLEKLHGQRSLMGCSVAWGCKESDTTEHACTHAYTCVRASTHTHTHELLSVWLLLLLSRLSRVRLCATP